MKLNKVSIPEVIKQINVFGKPQKIGIQKEFYHAGHHFVCESCLKTGCFKLEWKIIEIKDKN